MNATRRRESRDMGTDHPSSRSTPSPSPSTASLQSLAADAHSTPPPPTTHSVANKRSAALALVFLVSTVLYASDVYSLFHRFTASTVHPSDFVLSQLLAATVFAQLARGIDSSSPLKPFAQSAAVSASAPTNRGRLAGAVHAVGALAVTSCLADWSVLKTLTSKAIADPFIVLLIHHVLLPPHRFPHLVPRFYSVCALAAFAMIMVVFAASVVDISLSDIFNHMPYLSLAVVLPPLRDILLHTQFSSSAVPATSALPGPPLSKSANLNSALTSGAPSNNPANAPTTSMFMSNTSLHDTTFYTLTTNALPWSLVFTLFFRLNNSSDSNSFLPPFSLIPPLLRAGVYGSALQYASTGLLLTHAPFVHSAAQSFLYVPAIVVLLPLVSTPWSVQAVGLVLLAAAAIAAFVSAQTVRRPPVVSLRIKRLFLLAGLALFAIIVFFGGSMSVAHGVRKRRKNRAARNVGMDGYSLVYKEGSGKRGRKHGLISMVNFRRGREHSTNADTAHTGESHSAHHESNAHSSHPSTLASDSSKRIPSNDGEAKNSNTASTTSYTPTVSTSTKALDSIQTNASSRDVPLSADPPISALHERTEGINKLRTHDPELQLGAHDKEIVEGTPPGAFFHILEHFYHPPSITNVSLDSYEQAEKSIPQSFVDTLWQYAATARIATFAPSRTRTCGIEHSAETCVSRARVRASAAHVVVHLPLAEYLTPAHIMYIDRIREFARQEHVTRVIVTGLGAPLRKLPANLTSSDTLRQDSLIGHLSGDKNTFELDTTVIAALRKLQGLPVDLLVRGPVTHALIQQAGFGNSVVAGCPTLWLSDDVHLGRTWQQRINDLPKHSTTSTRIVVSMRAFKGYFKLMRAIHATYGTRVTFIAQTAWDLGNLRKMSVPLSQVRVPAGAEQWMDALKDAEVVLAGRVQVALMAGAVGTPALAIAPDLASVELARTVKVPFVTTIDPAIAPSSNHDKGVDVVKMIRKFAIDGDEFDRNRCQLAKIYLRIYEKVGLDVMPHIKSVLQQC